MLVFLCAADICCLWLLTMRTRCAGHFVCHRLWLLTVRTRCAGLFVCSCLWLLTMTRCAGFLCNRLAADNEDSLCWPFCVQLSLVADNGALCWPFYVPQTLAADSFLFVCSRNVLSLAAGSEDMLCCLFWLLTMRTRCAGLFVYNRLWLLTVRTRCAGLFVCSRNVLSFGC